MPSPSGTRLLERLTRNRAEESAADKLPKSSSPTLVKVRDPVEDVEAVVELEMESNHYGRKANRLLRKRGSMIGVDEEGRPTLDGRRCCLQLALSIDRKLHRIKMPAEFTCDCGTVWRVESRVREERHHV